MGLVVFPRSPSIEVALASAESVFEVTYNGWGHLPASGAPNATRLQDVILQVNKPVTGLSIGPDSDISEVQLVWPKNPVSGLPFNGDILFNTIPPKDIVQIFTKVGDLSNFLTPSRASVTAIGQTPDGNIIYSAVRVGAAGNKLRVQHVKPGPSTPLSTFLSPPGAPTTLTITLATNASGQITSTANQVIAAVNALTTSIMTAAPVGDGTGITAATPVLSFGGGADGPSGFTHNVGEVFLRDEGVTVSVRRPWLFPIPAPFLILPTVRTIWTDQIFTIPGLFTGGVEPFGNALTVPGQFNKPNLNLHLHLSGVPTAPTSRATRSMATDSPTFSVNVPAGGVPFIASAMPIDGRKRVTVTIFRGLQSPPADLEYRITRAQFYDDSVRLSNANLGQPFVFETPILPGNGFSGAIPPPGPVGSANFLASKEIVFDGPVSGYLVVECRNLAPGGFPDIPVTVAMTAYDD